jgi:hypothetical protein
MKVKVTVGRTFAGKQFENYRPEFTLEQEVPESADAKHVCNLMDEWRGMLDSRLEKAEAYWRGDSGLNKGEQTS